MKLLSDTPALVTVAELSKVVGIDMETVNNWLRHGTITRTSIGQRAALYSSSALARAATV
jgi:predicted site-specific integrase-resolvase